MALFKKILTFVFLAILSLTPLLWFKDKGNALINGIDTNFPLDPWMWFLRRLYVWTDFPNAGLDFSSSTAGLFFHSIQVIPYLLGFGIQHAQIISLVFWFSLIIFSSYFLARTIFPKNFLVQLLFVVLYSFNIFLFNTWENVKVANLSLVSAIPIAIAVLIKLREGELDYRKAALYSVITGIIVSGTGINPAYFVSFFLILIIFYLGNIFANMRPRSLLKTTRELLFVAFLVILINSFWILPTSYFIFQTIAPVGSIHKISFHYWINSLSENTSILNVMRGQGAWDWYALESKTQLPFYIPYALNYFHNLPFIIFSFLLPGLAILSLLVKEGRRRYLHLAFGMMFVLGVFLGAGTHLPTGALYRWLSNHLPFFTLFRSPWYIFTPLMTLAIAGLVSLLFYRIHGFLGEKRMFAGRLIAVLAMLIIIVGNLLYSYPLITGKIFRPGRDDGFYISFPSYIFDAKNWLSQNTDGRVIGYPDDEIEKFRWKYRGIESILGLLVDREVLFSPLNASESPIAKLIKQFYQELKKDQLSSAKSIANKLNISLLFEKVDQDSIALSLPGGIKSFASEKFDQWIFYNPSQNAYLPKIYSASNFIFDYSPDSGHKIVGILKDREVLVNPDDTVVASIPGVLNLSGRAVLARNSQNDALEEFTLSPSRLANRLIERDPTRVEFEFDIPQNGIYQPALERNQLEDFGIDITKEIRGELNGSQTGWAVSEISDSFVYFEKISLTKGRHKFTLHLQPVNLLSGGFENGPSFTQRGVGDFKVLGDQDEKYLSILNNEDLAIRKEQDIGARFTIPNFSAISDYLIQFKYRQIYGENGMVIVGQDKGDILVSIQVERLPNYPELNTFSFFYTPVRTESEMKIELLAPHIGDPLGTKIFYDGLELYKVFTNRLIFVQREENILHQPKINFDKISPSQYKGTVANAAGPHVMVFSENYSPEWELSIFNEEGKHVPIPNRQLVNKHFSANLYANAWYIDGVGENYEFEFFYKPQRLFWLGGLISLSTLLLSLFVYLMTYRKTKKQ